MFRENEEGIALVMVLILLVVIGTLAAVLLRSARTHTDVAVHEERMSQAFHSAEAGVEFALTNSAKISEKLFEEYNDGNYDKIDGDDDEYLYVYNSSENNGYGINIQEFDEEIDQDDVYYSFSDEENLNDIKFKIRILDGNFVSYEEIELESVGALKEGEEYKEEIRFGLKSGITELNNFNIGEVYEDREEHYTISGQEEEFEENINITNWDQDTFEDYYKYILEYDEEVDISDFTLKNDDHDKVGLTSNEKAYEIDESIQNELIHIKDDGNSKDGLDIDIKKDETIKDSIIIVEGQVNIESQTSIENSIVIVRDYVNASGISSAQDDEDEGWISPLFFIFSNEASQHGYFDIDGSGAVFELKSEPLPLELDDDFFKRNYSVQNWEQQ